VTVAGDGGGGRVDPQQARVRVHQQRVVGAHPRKEAADVVEHGHPGRARDLHAGAVVGQVGGCHHGGAAPAHQGQGRERGQALGDHQHLAAARQWQPGRAGGQQQAQVLGLDGALLEDGIAAAGGVGGHGVLTRHLTQPARDAVLPRALQRDRAQALILEEEEERQDGAPRRRRQRRFHAAHGLAHDRRDVLEGLLHADARVPVGQAARAQGLQGAQGEGAPEGRARHHRFARQARRARRVTRGVALVLEGVGEGGGQGRAQGDLRIGEGGLLLALQDQHASGLPAQHQRDGQQALILLLAQAGHVLVVGVVLGARGRDGAHDLGGRPRDALADGQPHVADGRVGEAHVRAQRKHLAVVDLFAHVDADHVGVGQAGDLLAHASEHAVQGPGLRGCLDQSQDAVDPQVVALVDVHANRAAALAHGGIVGPVTGRATRVWARRCVAGRLAADRSVMERPHGGLCERCQHAVEIRSGRGSRFLRCGQADRDRRFARYPPLPVLRCPGYAPAGESAGPESDV
jgi:hypothetical protein